MFFIKVKATKLIDNSSYPEIISCEFIDVNGCKHKFTEKWPIVSNERFENTFPKDCQIACVILEKKTVSYVVSTHLPWGIESTEGKTIFEISKELLIEISE